VIIAYLTVCLVLPCRIRLYPFDFGVFLLLARYVPNVAKRSIWEQCKYYILTTDLPATERWPTSHFKNFKWPYLRNRSFDRFHVLFYVGVFRDGVYMALFPVRTNPRWRKMAAAAILEKYQMAMSPQPVVRSTPCFVLGWVFWGRRI